MTWYIRTNIDIALDVYQLFVYHVEYLPGYFFCKLTAVVGFDFFHDVQNIPGR